MMIVFWGVAAALMAAALWFVIPPLLRGVQSAAPSRRALVQAVYRDKLAELEADRARGTLDEAQLAQARADLERQLLQDLLADQADVTPAERPRPRWLVPGLIVALPMSAVAFYLGQQSASSQLPRALATAPAPADTTPGAPSAMPAAHPAGQGGQASMSMEEAAERLAQRLAKQPDDGDGWLLLGNSYRFLHKDKEAAAAFERARALGKTPPPDAAAAAAGPAPGPGPTAVAGPAASTAAPAAANDRAAAPPTAAAAANGPAANGPAAPSTADVAALEATAKDHPDDAAAWGALGRAYQANRRFDDAAAAFGKAVALQPHNADWLADQADAVAAADNSLGGEAGTLIERALAADPHHVKALWLAASAARQRGEPAAALALWQRLQGELPADSPDAKIIAANIDEARAERDGAGTGSAAAAPAPTAAAVAPGPAQGVRGKVRLADSLNGEVSADDTLFVFARAAAGPPMPLAVLRKHARDLPLEFTLDDSQAVMPGMKLSSADQVVVGARISKSGNATPQPGDLEGASAPLRPTTAGPVDIVIERKR